MQPASSPIRWKPAWHLLHVSLPDPGSQHTFLRQAVVFLHALHSGRSHIPSSGQAASTACCQADIPLLWGASAVTRFSRSPCDESGQAGPTRWSSADSSDANCGLQCFTSFPGVPGTAELGLENLLLLTTRAGFPGKKSQAPFQWHPDIWMFSPSHQETIVLFLTILFPPLRTQLGDCPAGGFASWWECGCRLPTSVTSWCSLLEVGVTSESCHASSGNPQIWTRL